MRVKYRVPQKVAPELIQIGDEIQIDYGHIVGVYHTVKGVVAYRDEVGNTRVFKTKFGGKIYEWNILAPSAVTIKLISRESLNDQDPLFDTDFLDGVKERLG